MKKLSEQVNDMEMLLESSVTECKMLKMYLYFSLKKMKDNTEIMSPETAKEIFESYIHVDEDKQIRMMHDGREIAPVYEPKPKNCHWCSEPNYTESIFCSPKCKEEYDNDLPF